MLKASAGLVHLTVTAETVHAPGVEFDGVRHGQPQAALS